VGRARQEAADRLENVRFVRQLSPMLDPPRPFRGVDLRGSDLAGLDLREAYLVPANGFC